MKKSDRLKELDKIAADGKNRLQKLGIKESDIQRIVEERRKVNGKEIDIDLMRQLIGSLRDIKEGRVRRVR